ncbi:excinuclease ABC subunit UvrA [Desulforamulus aeronauticus]|uniref:UvrABC system protein A n=1 Tax=Desulforamulus aeronauticus DSM 10349 TaxID=1121421 RepID=A0A1M6V5S7_9FIRM|nr:excinuclease ABC subunit UvrA [Desulforamulus aeronauticus]SHK76745.1 Excinuclease ABC subunit A [Desulforamulus aeronauticus DSM 10349]
MQDKILIKGARSHNLKNIDVEIPRDKLVVITGLSGSGKSSLAFDTIYAEGQRRYVESLSAYARQFLGQMTKPDVDYIEGLSPAISIDQKTTSHNPRSTVGTVTEIYDYLRLLFARAGRVHCPKCGQPIAQQTVQQMVDQLMVLPESTKLMLLAPVIRGKKGEHVKIFEDIRRNGFVRVRVNGEIYDVTEPPQLDKKKKHTIEIVVDRIVIRPGSEKRLADSMETALKQSEGVAIAAVVDGEEFTFSENFACTDCGVNISEISPRLFSFNNPHGACPECTGLGFNHEFDPDLIIPDQKKSIREGAIEGWHKGSIAAAYLSGLAEKYEFSLDTPMEELTPKQMKVILHGTGNEKVKFNYTDSYGHVHRYEVPFEGIIGNLSRRYRETQSESMREEFEKYMSSKPCPSCRGARLRPEALAVKVGGKDISDITALPVLESLHFFRNLDLTSREQLIARQILKEINERLGFLVNVGLNYLTLGRAAGTLSGGEAQRIRLATQIGSGLMGVLYILDEPSIGLHQRDNERLITTLKRLRDLGNTLIVVEHDEDTIRVADHVIDIGPRAGRHGGEVVAAGTMQELMEVPESLTGQYLSGKKFIPVPLNYREGKGQKLIIQGAAANNLKGINVEIPLGQFVAITGVSGSGKSTLINEILYKSLAHKLHRAKDKPGEHTAIQGIEHLEKVIDVNQSPIGRTPRSNPATYTGVFGDIRELFTQMPEAKVRGYKPGRFSFNVKGGRCEACQGDGIIKIEMHFLPDVYVPCEICKGLRYNRETLEVKYKGKSIADVLNMEVDEAVDFFANIPKIHRRLKTLQDVGLGYIRLGQPAPELSGGEAQRVKLATELSRRSNGGTIYILDEPTTGLHTADIAQLLEVLHRLVDNGSTVVVIEHNLDVIKTADHIIDLGPEGGDKGGTLVAVGTPEEICQVADSYTGQFLKPVLERDRQRTVASLEKGELPQLLIVNA